MGEVGLLQVRAVEVGLLQVCVEEYLFADYDRNADTLKAAIAKAKTLDISYLPDRQKRAMTEAFQAADKTFDLVAIVRKTERALNAYIPEYRPQHILARDL